MPLSVCVFHSPPVFWLILKLSKEVSISTVDNAVQWALSALLQSINITKMARRVGKSLIGGASG